MADNKYHEMNACLCKAYEQWFSDLQTHVPELLTDKYSNPYYTCIPKGWCDSNVRILIVGEEGFGYWGRGREEGIQPSNIEQGQTYCWSSLASYLHYGLEYELYPNSGHFSAKRSPFWVRARKIAERGICAWTNIDLIHKRSDKPGQCVLDASEREKLHSIRTKILSKEIEIMKPTHVVFMGWYGTSLQHELPDIFKELYPGGLGDSSRWKNNAVLITNADIHYIFTYHPNWGIRHPGYEDHVMELLESTLF